MNGDAVTVTFLLPRAMSLLDFFERLQELGIAEAIYPGSPPVILMKSLNKSSAKAE